MKKLSFLISMLLIAVVLFAKPALKRVQSVADFEQLYKDKVVPFNKISDTTFLRLKLGIVFDEKNYFRGFEYIGGLRKELTYKEYLKFNELLLGYKQVYSEKDKEQYEKRRGR